jgi:voltage-gated potassium channel
VNGYVIRKQYMPEWKKTVICVLIFFAIIVSGTIGYMIIEGWDFTDAFYMSVITLTTVGYSEVHELGNTGKIFTVVLILAGVGVIVYIISMLAQFVVEGRLRQVLGRHKLEKKIQGLKDHYIVCGYGRVGETICSMFSTKSLKLVVIEKDPEKTALLHEKGVLHVAGEATDEETLTAAGIEHAGSLITVLGNDRDNVYVTLSARGLNSGLFIMARSSDVGSGRKLLRAGADKVVSPYRIGARRMAQMILRPALTDFLDLAMMDKNIDIQMEEISVKASSRLIGIPLQDSGIRRDLNLIIIAVKKDSGDMLFNPSSRATIEAGDIVIVVGERNNLEKLKIILNSEP